jgi:hypothetical protein
VEKSKWLKAAIDEKDRLDLREVLLARSGLLERLAALPAPSIPEDLDHLERINQQYRKLIASLAELNIALTRAADRLKAD